MSVRRLRLPASVAAAVVAASVLLGAVPADATTFDGQPVRETYRFTVAGKHWSLTDRSYGTATRTVHVGRTSGKVPAHYRLAFRDDRGHVLARVLRGLEQQAYMIERFTDARFATAAAFRAAERRVLTVSSRTANAHWAKGLRILSVQSDLESTIVATSDYLDGLAAGAHSDFAAVRTVRSSEYPGSATVSGNDTKSWTVTVRDTRDGYGMVFDAATGAEAELRF
jgi:hypothetical protein